MGAVELMSISADRGRLQDAADAAVLDAAGELSVAGPGGVIERTQAYALQRAADVATRQELEAAATLNNNTVELVVTARRGSFFGNLLPPGGFHTRVTASAASVGSVPLCVVALHGSGSVIHLQNTARIQATGCLISANRDLETAAGTRVDSTEIQLAGVQRGSGVVNPSALAGAPVAADPFATRQADINSVVAACSSARNTDYDADERTITLNPGAYSGNIKATEEGTIRLNPGVYVFCNGGRLEMDHDGRLEGNGVTIFVAQGFQFAVKEEAEIELYGSRTGQWAGMVMVAPPTRTSDIVFEAKHWRRLEGVIYTPAARLVVQGSASAAAESNWTVTVAKQILVKGSPTLTINSNYAASDVPVPGGVGPTSSGPRLAR